MHELLFRHQKALADDDLRRYATDLGLDVARFDLDRAGVGGRVRRDVESGMASGEVRGALFIDDAVHREAYDAATLREAVAR
jgi:hypothetical protein